MTINPNVIHSMDAAIQNAAHAGEPLSIENGGLQAYGYTLAFTDECGTEQTIEFLAAHDIQAMAIAQNKCRGCEGLWSGVSLSGGPTDDAIDFQPF